MDPMSDSAFYEGSIPSRSGASVNQQTFSSDIPPPPQLFQQQMAAMPSTNIITCRLCQQIFLEPVIFPCGHTFCLACSEEWRKRQRVCPQAGCEKPLGEAVPNLLVKEAVVSHRTMEAKQQQVLMLQVVNVLQHQQQLLAAATGMVDHPRPMSPSEANDLYDDDIEPRGQQWIGPREVDGRASRRNFQRARNRDSGSGSVSLELTCTGGHQEKMPLIKESSADESPTVHPKESQKQELTQPHPSTTRYIPNKAFVRGTPGRRTEIHQMPIKPVSSIRRSLKARFSFRPKERVPGRSAEDVAAGIRMIQHEGNGVWMGDGQQNESQESSDLASHPMNKFMQAKKDKSLWSKAKHVFSSNKK